MSHLITDPFLTDKRQTVWHTARHKALKHTYQMDSVIRVDPEVNVAYSRRFAHSAIISGFLDTKKSHINSIKFGEDLAKRLKVPKNFKMDLSIIGIRPIISRIYDPKVIFNTFLNEYQYDRCRGRKSKSGTFIHKTCKNSDHTLEDGRVLEFCSKNNLPDILYVGQTAKRQRKPSSRLFYSENVERTRIYFILRLYRDFSIKDVKPIKRAFDLRREVYNSVSYFDSESNQISADGLRYSIPDRYYENTRNATTMPKFVSSHKDLFNDWPLPDSEKKILRCDGSAYCGGKKKNPFAKFLKKIKFK